MEGGWLRHLLLLCLDCWGQSRDLRVCFQGVGLAQLLRLLGCSGHCQEDPVPGETLPPSTQAHPWLWTRKARPRRPTLGLKAMSFRTISTVKRPVKGMLRMFMAILNRQL